MDFDPAKYLWYRVALGPFSKLIDELPIILAQTGIIIQMERCETDTLFIKDVECGKSQWSFKAQCADRDSELTLFYERVDNNVRIGFPKILAPNEKQGKPDGGAVGGGSAAAEVL